MLHVWKVVVLLLALGSCSPATAGEPITLTGHLGGVYCVGFSPDGNVLVSGSVDGTVRLWQLPVAVSRTEQQRRQRLLSDLDDDRFVVREQASRELAKLGREAQPTLRKALKEAASLEARARLRRLLAALRAPAEEQHQAEVRCVAFSLDGKFFASGSKDKRIKLWDAGSGQVVATIDGRSGTIWSLAFSPDGSMLASGGMDHSVRLWDVAARRLHATLQGHSGPVHSIAFSPDGRTLATAGSFDGTVRLWNVANCGPRAALKGRGGAVLCVAFSPDGKTLASAGYDGAIELWDLATDELPLPESIQAHSGAIRALAFSPDGKTLASGSEDNSTKLWEMAGRRLGATLTGHAGAVHAVAFSPNGRTIATGSLDGTVKLRDLSARRGPTVVGQAP